MASTFIPVGALGDDFICIKQRDYLMHGPPPHERKRGELRLIKQLDLYRDDAEKEFVQKRLAEIWLAVTRRPSTCSRRMPRH